MSKLNHPNFHAVGFATDMMGSFHDRLRINHEKISDHIQDEIRKIIIRCVSEVETEVDRSQGQIP